MFTGAQTTPSQGAKILGRFISGKTGTHLIFSGAANFDLEIVESRTLDDNIQEVIYRSTLHG